MNRFKVFFLSVLLFSSLYSSDGIKKVSLQLQWKYQFQFAGYIMAKEKGFYKNAGLDVEIKEWSYGINTVDEALKGSSQYAVARATSMIDISKGKDIVYLAVIFQSNPLILLADKSSGIATVKDFTGKRMMSSGDMNTDASFISMMMSQGVNINDITMQKPSYDVKDLINGKTDLMASYITNEPYVIKELGGEPVIFNPKDYGFDFCNDIVITSQEYLKKEPEEVKSFKEATLKGWEYAFANIDETVDLIFNKYNTQNKSKAALVYEAKELKKLAYFQTNRIGKIDQNKLEKIYDVYKLLGLVKNNINFNKVVYNELTLDLQLTNKEKEYLKNKGSITMCIDPNWMPFEKFDDKGRYTGMSADYYKLFEKNLSTKFNVIRTDSWSETLEYAKQRKCDILSLVMETPERRKYLNFTTPYLTTPLVVATKLDVPFVNDVNDLKGKKIGIPKGYAFAELLKNKYPYLNIIEVENIEEGLSKVNKNKLDAYVGTLASVGYSLQKDFQGELKIAGKFSENWSLGIGVRNDDRVLLQILQKAVNNLDSNQKREILNKWISVKYEKGIDYTLIRQILFVFFLFVLYVLYKQYLLKKSIKETGELIDATMEAILISKNGKCLDVNKSAVDLFGYSSKSEMTGVPIIEFVADDSKSLVKEKIKLDDAKPYEGNVIKKDGTVIPALLRGFNLKSKGLRVSSIIDITQLKQLESQAKLASMGEMLGNIAHQWRQPLSVISTAATAIPIKKEHGILDDSELDQMCSQINENAQYLSQTIDDFRNFIKGDTKPVKFDLKNDTDSFIKLVDSSIKKYNILLILDLEENINIKGYPNELIQCFINIFNNSRDAFVDNKVNEDERYVFISQKTIDNKIKISFKDNAGGIPKNILPRIFEPYFTTKHQNKGTGLGLHMSYNLIVNHMNGSIDVYNEDFEFRGKKYKGARFVITLPL